ncbi:MAG: protein kinase [Deltaproteobacteria bacterium]|nr:protein kinase [Deltaproteobacteria bacterium]
MIGEIIGNVRITSEIGQGGMGMLYMAEHVNVGKPFAVRHLAPELAQNQMYHERFIKEAKALAQLKHDNIVRIYEVIEKEGNLFLVMEYVDGDTLDSILKNRGVLSEKEALSITKSILKGLNYAHSKGAIHRDIKPSNIIRTKQDVAKIMDFGIALMGRGARLTKTGKVMGAAKYMSPEQIAQAKQIDLRSDVYSMGVITYEMLTGQVPFDGETDAEIYEKHEKAAPPDMQSIVENISPALNKITIRALEKKPHDRYHGCADFLKYLQAYETGDVKKVAKEEKEMRGKEVAEIVPEGAFEQPETSKRPAKKISTRAMIGMGIATVLIIAVGAFMTMRFMESRRMKAEYESVLAQVGNVQKLERKERLLRLYVKSHKKNQHTINAEMRIIEIRGFIQERDYKIAIGRADILRTGKDYEKAENTFKEYLKKHPQSTHAAEFKEKISELRVLMANRDYEKLKNLAQDNYKSRIKAYASYLTNYPKGKHKNVVEGLFSDISEEYFNYLKDEVIVCDKLEDWAECIQLCNHFTGSLKDKTHLDEVKAIRIDLEKKEPEHKDLAKLMQKAKLKRKDYRAVKQIYSDYLKANPGSTEYIKGKIKNELARLDEKREWENTLAYGKNEQNDLGKRISRLRRYIGKESTGLYVEDAKKLLKRLQKEEQGVKRNRRLADIQRKKELEQRKWNEINAVIRNREIYVFDRIRSLESYISQSPSAKYAGHARSKLEQLKAEGKEWTRMEGIRKRLSVQLANSGGVFIDNGDGTVRDKRNGLIWCMLDSIDTLKKCMNYESTLKYVKTLKTGGHGNWRLPTARELALIYKSEPFFPFVSERRYWTSETRGKASWQTVSIVSSKKDRSFSMEYVNVKKCCAVRAVRP